MSVCSTPLLSHALKSLFNRNKDTIHHNQCDTGQDSVIGLALNTVNSEIFTRILFSYNFTYAKFRENKLKHLCHLLI